MKNKFLLLIALLLPLNLFAGSSYTTRYPAAKYTIAYSSNNVSTSAWTQIASSLPQPITHLEIFDSSGQILQIGVGASGSESGIFYVMPGGNGPMDINIDSGTRLSIKAVSATANAGNLVINAYY